MFFALKVIMLNCLLFFFVTKIFFYKCFLKSEYCLTIFLRQIFFCSYRLQMCVFIPCWEFENPL